MHVVFCFRVYHINSYKGTFQQISDQLFMFESMNNMYSIKLCKI